MTRQNLDLATIAYHKFTLDWKVK